MLTPCVTAGGGQAYANAATTINSQQSRPRAQAVRWSIVGGWSRPIYAAILAGTAAPGLAACATARHTGAATTIGTFPVQVTTASFPRRQRLAQRTQLVIAVRNAGNRTIPDLAVTITDPPYGTSVQPFATYLDMPGVASHSRPVWIIDQPPGPCEYACRAGGLGGAVTAYANTWALGPLRRRAAATFEWTLTAVQSGTYLVRYEVAAGIDVRAKAVLADGSQPSGAFRVTISQAAQRFSVNAGGQIVTTG